MTRITVSLHRGSLLDTARRQKYVEAVLKENQRLRTIRRKRLHAAERRIRNAVQECQSLDTGRRPEVRIRQAFVRLATPRRIQSEADNGTPADQSSRLDRSRADWMTRPPAAKLVVRRSYALSFYLSVIYLAHLESGTKGHLDNERGNAARMDGRASWATVVGLGGGPTTRARRARVCRALDVLESARLVDLAHENGFVSYERFRVLRDDGDESPYTVPGQDSRAYLVLPASFFYNGWHLVLEPREIVMMLAIIDMTRKVAQRQTDDYPGVALPEIERWRYYGLSGETYEAIHELAEFGLIDIHDPMPNRRRGRITQHASRPMDDETGLAPIPYRFTYDISKFDRDAYATVTSSLATRLSPRLAP
jgi:hypothetical protein